MLKHQFIENLQQRTNDLFNQLFFSLDVLKIRRLHMLTVA